MTQAILFLLAALLVVPIALRLGLGSVLGYLLTGVVIGLVGLALVNDPAAILQVSELGVVLMLFVIGLELEPKRLWAMRGAVFGVGAMEMVVCTALLLPVGLLMCWSWQTSLVASLALSLSSTAMVVGLLQERNLMARRAEAVAHAARGLRSLYSASASWLRLACRCLSRRAVAPHRATSRFPGEPASDG